MPADPLLLTAQQKALLEPLRSGSPVPVDQLIRALYACRPDGGPDDAAQTVRSMIYYLRKALAPAGIAILTIGQGRASQGYMVDPAHLQLLDGALAHAWQGALGAARAQQAHVAA